MEYNQEQVIINILGIQSEEQLMKQILNVQTEVLKTTITLWKNHFLFRNYDDQQLQQLTFALNLILKLRKQDVETSFKLKEEQLQKIITLIKRYQSVDYLLELCSEIYQQNQYIMHSNQKFFSSLIERFCQIKHPETRQKILFLVLMLMSQNLGYVKLVDQPYYFLEYLVFRINSETNENKSLEFFSYISKIYQSPHSNHLFSGSDFKILINVLVRLIENTMDEGNLILYLETYIILSIHEKMGFQGQHYKLQDILLVLEQSELKSAKVLQLTEELKSLLKK